ncbi:MAG: ribonuclease H-like YkuK family protein, partial [Patescibacteria group bacterium]
GLRLSPEQIVREVINFMEAEPRYEYKITIGTDSLKASDNTADFVTAIVIHRVGKGGRYFWRRIEDETKFHTLRDRIWKEVLMSLDIAKSFLALLNASASQSIKFDFAIHVDVGQNGATRVMIQELVGMIRANNFEAKTKPESYAASNVADRHV